MKEQVRRKSKTGVADHWEVSFFREASIIGRGLQLPLKL